MAAATFASVGLGDLRPLGAGARVDRREALAGRDLLAPDHERVRAAALVEAEGLALGRDSHSPARYNAAASRSSSSSLVQKPIDARTHGSVGRCRTITPCSARRRDSPAASLLSHVTSVACPRALTSSTCGATSSRPRSACVRARSKRPGPTSSRKASEASAPSSCARLSQPQSKRAAAGLRRERAGLVVAVLRVVRGRGHGEPFDPLGRDHEAARSARAEQPLLPREGVEVDSGRGHRDRPDRLRSVREHGHAEPGELVERQQLPGRPGDVRDGDQLRRRADLDRDRVERGLRRAAAQLRRADRRARCRQRAEQPEVLDVGRHDLVAGADPEPCADDRAALGRRAGEGERLGRDGHDGRKSGAEPLAQLEDLRRVPGARPAALVVEPVGCGHRVQRAPRQRAEGARVEPDEAVEDAELGAYRFEVHQSSTSIPIPRERARS